MSAAEGFLKRGDELIHAGLGFGREVRLYPILADGFAQGAIGFAGALLPARGRFLLAGERLAEEVEVFIVEGLGQVCGRGSESCASAGRTSSYRRALKRPVR